MFWKTSPLDMSPAKYPGLTGSSSTHMLVSTQQCFQIKHRESAIFVCPVHKQKLNKINRAFWPHVEYPWNACPRIYRRLFWTTATMLWGARLATVRRHCSTGSFYVLYIAYRSKIIHLPSSSWGTLQGQGLANSKHSIKDWQTNEWSTTKFFPIAPS